MTSLNCKECSAEFIRNPNGGTHLFCSQKCQVKYWKDNNRAKNNARQNRWVNKYPNRHRLTHLRTRAKKKNFECNLTEEDLERQPDICPVLGIPLFKSSNSKTHNSPSVDRIDNSKGYIKGNVRIISDRANSLKSDATIEELELILADAKRLQWELSKAPSGLRNG